MKTNPIDAERRLFHYTTMSRLSSIIEDLIIKTGARITYKEGARRQRRWVM